jgi:hypothetical protein
MKITLPKKLTQGWTGSLFYAVVGILFAVIFYYGILATVLSTNMPVVAVVSNSMKHDSSLETDYYQWLEQRGYNINEIKSWPISGGFVVGDMPIIKGSSGYNVGDVIVYSVPGLKSPIIHRIIKINPEGTYQTKGDNNPAQAPYELNVTKAQIHGKVVFIIPKLGYFKVLINKVFGI